MELRLPINWPQNRQVILILNYSEGPDVNESLQVKEEGRKVDQRDAMWEALDSLPPPIAGFADRRRGPQIEECKKLESFFEQPSNYRQQENTNLSLVAARKWIWPTIQKSSKRSLPRATKRHTATLIPWFQSSEMHTYQIFDLQNCKTVNVLY